MTWIIHCTDNPVFQYIPLVSLTPDFPYMWSKFYKIIYTVSLMYTKISSFYLSAALILSCSYPFCMVISLNRTDVFAFLFFSGIWCWNSELRRFAIPQEECQSWEKKNWLRWMCVLWCKIKHSALFIMR